LFVRNVAHISTPDIPWQEAAMSTIKDVAKRAGVAIATVSAVVNRSAPVSQETILRVEKAIAEIGYFPHGAAQSLRTGRSMLIGLLIPDIANPHFATVASVVERVCLNAGYMTAVYSTSEDFDREMQILRMMRRQRVAGLIIIPTRSNVDHGNQLLAAIHVPTVLLDSHVDGLPFDVVKLDNRKAGRIAADYVLGLGHRRIAPIIGRDSVATGIERLAGFLEAHKKHRIAVDRSIFVAGEFNQSAAYHGTTALMQRGDRPTAIIAFSNMMMLGVLNALHDLGIAVPNSASVIGIDDFDFAKIMNPPPTVVSAPVAEMAEMAINKLLSEIVTKAKPTGARQLYQPSLVLRNSCTISLLHKA
jgi:DNA-binding LacI/PurR family transcriptional regulator